MLLSLQSLYSPQGIAMLISIFLFVGFFHIVYQCFLHPLAKYPGPLLASLTNVWKTYYVYKHILHEKLVELHEQHGPVIRIGPNDLHFWNAEAIPAIYKAGKAMGKTEFYDGFTTFNPNLFGTRNEALHSVRRRQVSHGFSQASIEKMEPIIDDQMSILINHVKGFAKTGEIFDMKNLISCFVLDVLGDVAFGRSFDAQIAGRADEIPAINDHILLSCLIGEMGAWQDVLKALMGYSPIAWIRRITRSRRLLKEKCASCVRRKMEDPSERLDLLQSLVRCQDPGTGARLTELDINTEAFAMLVAGSHSTSGTLGFLFWHLLHNRDVLDKVVQELDTSLGPLSGNQVGYSIKGLEGEIPYTMACARENFRIHPVFSMNLWRRVNMYGAEIGEFIVPHGTNVCISNYALHHNPDIWGADHNTYRPDRWLEGKANTSNLIPFSVGHRMCIGKNLAMTNILKTTSTLLAMFEFETLSNQPARLLSSGIGELEGGFLCRVKMRRSRGEE
ncbi:Pisatin demethylase [Lachnellula arida]|uniref:Pisatin demethylase n=1 Tax=Lachnellula arida TaxID=1316785 RepID=A0A8T9BDV7_9HELO|nr:Pisatin demethylase [Lachnellula arida]